MDILIGLGVLWLAAKWCERNEEHLKEVNRKKFSSVYQHY